MGKKPNTERYEMNRMDEVIEQDVAELRALMSDLPEPSEPHPAYWNNFLLRVHERVEQKQAPKKKAWWSPALIWGSLTGVAAMLVIAFVTGLFPFGSSDVVTPGQGTEVLADAVPSEDAELTLTPRPLDAESDLDMLIPGPEEEFGDASYTIVLTQDDLDMIEAIQADDDDAILQAMIDDVNLEI